MQTLPAKLAYRSLLKTVTVCHISAKICMCKSSHWSMWSFFHNLKSTTTILTLVSSWEGGFTIMAEFFPSVRQQRGRAIQWLSWLVRAPKNLLVLHPNVLSQPLLRGCHIFTLVTLQFLGSSRIITGNPSWRFLLLLRNEFLSSPDISPESWGACHLLGTLACNCLAPGVQWEGEVRTNWDGEVERLALAGQRLAESHALRGQGRIFISHFEFTSEVRKCWSCS